MCTYITNCRVVTLVSACTERQPVGEKDTFVYLNKLVILTAVVTLVADNSGYVRFTFSNKG